jgi:hypothetical protein
LCFSESRYEVRSCHARPYEFLWLLGYSSAKVHETYSRLQPELMHETLPKPVSLGIL